MPYTSIPAFTTTPSRLSSPTTFSTDMDTFLSQMASRVSAMNANGTYWDDLANTIQAQAAAAAAGVNVAVWVTGTTYAIGDVRYSPITFYAYRRKTAGAGATDPSADTTNWALVSGSGDVSQTGAQTLTNKTISFANNTLTGVASTAFAIAAAVAL